MASSSADKEKGAPPPVLDDQILGPGSEALAAASDLFNKGSKALEDGDFASAADCLSRALEIRVAHYGELAPECAISYYKFGCALLYKSQEEADPLVTVPKNPTRHSEKDKSSQTVGEDEGLNAAASTTKERNTTNNIEEEEEEKEGASDKDQEEEEEEEEEEDEDGSDGDGEEFAEADEEDSDLDLAWKMLDVARAIVEKCPEDNIQKVNIFAALAEVSMEREDFETSLNDYLKALSILERLSEPQIRRMVELNFRICLVLEVWSKVEEAIPYCQKAISLCESRLKELNEDVESTVLSKDNMNITNDSGIGGSQALSKGETELTSEGDEKVIISSILSELERKLEDLQHVLANPKPIFSEIMKMVSSKPASAETDEYSAEARSASLSSSKMGAEGGGFDSPTISTAATNGGGANGGGITHLGVVGRGVKRASLNPTGSEPTSKKHSLDLSSEKDGNSVSGVDSTIIDVGTPKG